MVKPDEFVRTVVEDSGISMYGVSKRMQRSPLYIGGMVSRKQLPTIQTMAEICDATGHDFLARNRNTGKEIFIEPPND